VSPRIRLANLPVAERSRIEQAQDILKQLGFDRSRTNERSALVLLALLDLKSTTPWDAAQGRTITVREALHYIRDHYGIPLSDREAPRRQTLHQFRDAAFVIENADAPDTEVNNPAYNYRVQEDALALLRTYGTPAWAPALAVYLGKVETLRAQQRTARGARLVSLRLPDGREFTLTPGKHNRLISDIVTDFCRRHLKEPVIIYVGDAGDKMLHFEREFLAALGVTLDEHGTLPDVIVYDRAPGRGWLILAEAVTSHGPVSLKRHRELEATFGTSKAGLVYVTAFPTVRAMKEHLHDIGWETEVWVAEKPDHLIHFDGERFLGPYKPPPASE
jgi:hypothetical protein